MPHPSPANGLAPPLPADGQTTLTRALALALLLHAAGAALLWGMGLTSSPLPLPQGDAVQVALYAPANNPGGNPADNLVDNLADNLAGTRNGGSAATTPAQAAEPPPAAQAAPAPPEQAQRTAPDTTPRPATRQKPPRRDRGHNRAREKAHTGSATGIPSQATPGTEGTEGTKDTGAQGGSSRGAGHGMTAGQGPAPLGQGVNPRPRYPELARQRGQEGVVLLRVQVDAQGMPTHVLVQQSSGHSLLDDAARDAVRRWRFSPARHLGRPVPGAVAVPVHFRLR